MKKADIVVGRNYKAKVSGRLVTVRVDAIQEHEGFRSAISYSRRVRGTTNYDVTNLATGRKLRFRSAGRFRYIWDNETPG
jgi:hypothetical protein